MQDPSALLEYARSAAANEIGDFVNGWAFLIDGAFARMRRSGSPNDRELYREAALVSIEAARSHTSMPAAFWDDKIIEIRVAYLRNTDKGEEWVNEEALGIFREFTNRLAVDYDTAVYVISASRHESSDAMVSALFRIAGMLLWVGEILPLLPKQEREELERWLAIRESILRWRNAP